MVDRTVRPSKAEVEDLRAAMRDVQASIVAYYDATAGFHETAEAFEAPARTAIGAIQKVNEVLSQEIGQKGKYRRIRERQRSERHVGAELIGAFTYARNVTAHKLFRISPDPVRAVGGPGIGYLTSAVWGSVPKKVHDSLHLRTRELRPYYDDHLVGRPVLETFLDAAAHLAQVCPRMVHRDAVGEWTGFPLRGQPGLPIRLHPEEPSLGSKGTSTYRKHRRWLERRRPGGDLRLICGRATAAEADYIFGLTFRGRASFCPFVEAADQVIEDVATEFPYHLASSPTDHLELSKTGPLRNGADLQYILSKDPLEDWVGEPTEDIGSIEPFSSVLPEAEWRRQIDMNCDDPLVRRDQRLASVYPLL